MLFLLVAFLLLALFPVFVCFARAHIVLERTKKAIEAATPPPEVLEELLERMKEKLPLKAFVPPTSEEHDRIEQDVQQLFSRTRFWWPAILLSILYALTAVWAHAYIVEKWVKVQQTQQVQADPAKGPATGIQSAAQVSSTQLESHLWYLKLSDRLATLPVEILLALVGAFVFNTGSTVRRIFVSDVTEQVFWGAINRLVATAGLSVVLSISVAPSTVTAKAPFFAIGFMVNGVIDFFLQKLSGLLSSKKPKTDELPLEMIAGIDLWKEYRLEEEGIEGIQNLATADVKELAIRTHYNLHTLVDWIDQAILIQALGEKVNLLRSQAVSISAIEFALASPQAGAPPDYGKFVAKAIGADELVIATLMNNLYYDLNVRTLWFLWQYQGKSATTPPPQDKNERVLSATAG